MLFDRFNKARSSGERAKSLMRFGRLKEAEQLALNKQLAGDVPTPDDHNGDLGGVVGGGLDREETEVEPALSSAEHDSTLPGDGQRMRRSRRTNPVQARLQQIENWTKVEVMVAISCEGATVEKIGSRSGAHRSAPKFLSP